MQDGEGGSPIRDEEGNSVNVKGVFLRFSFSVSRLLSSTIPKLNLTEHLLSLVLQD